MNKRAKKATPTQRKYIQEVLRISNNGKLLYPLICFFSNGQSRKLKQMNRPQAQRLITHLKQFDLNKPVTLEI